MSTVNENAVSPISADVVRQITENLRNNTVDMAEEALRVPVANFVSDAHAVKERDLFRRLPLVVAHCSELPKPGNFITREVLGTSLLIVRQDDGVVATYLNMCRHRGGKVEFNDSGTRHVFVCRYHGWSYERNGGALRSVPYKKFYGSIDHSCNGLTRFTTEERHGFIWVDLSNNAQRTVADYLGPDLDAQLASLELDKTVIFTDKPFKYDINWKLVVDGAFDLLHPPFLHPDSVGQYFDATAGLFVDYGRHGVNYAPKKKAVQQVKAGEPVNATWKSFSAAFRIYPNSFVIRAPDHVEFWTVWPSTESASKSTIHIRFLIDPNLLDEKMKERLNLSWTILSEAALTEDFPMEEAIQTNSLAHPDGTFLYGQLEVAGQHFHRQLHKDIGNASE